MRSISVSQAIDAIRRMKDDVLSGKVVLEDVTIDEGDFRTVLRMSVLCTKEMK